jgi:hypothetical protein
MWDGNGGARAKAGRNTVHPTGPRGVPSRVETPGGGLEVELAHWNVRRGLYRSILHPCCGGWRSAHTAPLEPGHVRVYCEASGDLQFRWIRRGRIDADSWLATDMALGEERGNLSHQGSCWRATGLIGRCRRSELDLRAIATPGRFGPSRCRF